MHTSYSETWLTSGNQGKIGLHIGNATSKMIISSVNQVTRLDCLRLHCGKNVLPWIYSLLLNHSQHILSQEQSAQMLDSLFKVVCFPFSLPFSISLFGFSNSSRWL